MTQAQDAFATAASLGLKDNNKKVLNEVLRGVKEDIDTNASGISSINSDLNDYAAAFSVSGANVTFSGTVTASGTSTAHSFIPTSNSVPTNGMYLSAANSVAISTNGTGRLFIDSAGSTNIVGASAEFKGTNTNNINTTGGTEQLFKFDIEGQRNDSYASAGSIIFRQDNNTWSTTNEFNKPTRIEFCTQDSSTSDTSETPRLVIDQDGLINIANTPIYADNAAAKTGGLVDGDVYRTSTGDLKIVYT